MENNSLKKIEKILRIVFLMLAVIVVAGVVILLKIDSSKPYITEQKDETSLEETFPGEEEDESEWAAGLSDSTLWLPKNCGLYEPLPKISFYGRNDRVYDMDDWKGKTVVLVFWASWCEDCQKQMPKMAEFEKIASQYGDVSFLYINRTDGKRETRETAENYFEELGVSGRMYYDISELAYNTLGIQNIPTTLFLDKEGRIAAWSPKQIEEESEFEALLKDVIYGKAAVTAEFVTQYMMDAEGGIHSQFKKEREIDSQSEVLSESQGLFMLYAAETEDRQLFDRAFSYVKNQLWQDGLAAWKKEYGETGEVNALIDDFRIYRALCEAQELWGGYEEDILTLQNALLEWGIEKNQYVDFYDWSNSKYASRFTLCYGDLEVMQLLAKESAKGDAAYKKALEIMERGQISNEFPLYYSWYNYARDKYEKDDLNSAEAMVTLLHLARQGRLKSNTIKWLKNQMAGEGIKMRYTIKGEVVKGYNYDSTAVYAIVVMIADEIGDDTLRQQALKKMEKMRINDTSLEYNGAFGMEDGSGITSFDQLMPMLAYQRVE